MKKIILSFLIINIFIAASSFAAQQQQIRSTAQKTRKEKARCEAMEDAEKKEECLNKLEEKIEKRRKAESGNK